MGMSWGIPGIRFGISPSGQKYISFGIPGTGIYFIKYLARTAPQNQSPDTFTSAPSMTKPQGKATNNGEPWWKQKNLLKK